MREDGRASEEASESANTWERVIATSSSGVSDRECKDQWEGAAAIPYAHTGDVIDDRHEDDDNEEDDDDHNDK